MNDVLHTLLRACLAGFCIGIAAFGYLINPTIGMILFAFGLAVVVMEKYALYTGVVGGVDFRQPTTYFLLLLILLGNFLGSAAVALIACCSPLADQLQTASTAIVTTRLATGWWRCGILAIGCGFLVDSGARIARRGQTLPHWLPLLFGVPLFILCGFPHSIADMTYHLLYYAQNPTAITASTVLRLCIIWLACALGNALGGNLWRIFDRKNS